MGDDVNVQTRGVYFCTAYWRSSADYSRPEGDKPTKGDYLLTKKGAFRIVDVKHDQDGWNLLAEPVGGWEPWANDPPSVVVFDWEWRTRRGR